MLKKTDQTTVNGDFSKIQNIGQKICTASNKKSKDVRFNRI